LAGDADSPQDAFFVFGAAGSGSDDVWFAGGRGRFRGTVSFACPILVHKTAGNYSRLVDNVINDTDFLAYRDVCQEKAGASRFMRGSFDNDGGYVALPWTNGGWLTSIAPAGPGAVVGVMGGGLLAYASVAGGGAAWVDQVNLSVVRNHNLNLHPAYSLLSSIW